MSAVTYHTDVSGPRGADLEDALLAAGRLHNVQVTIDRTRGNILRKTVYFTVTGEQADINDFADAMINAIKATGHRTRG